MAFACSICEQESARICVSCTKDACDNHICESCHCCSDCCDCDVPLAEPEAEIMAAALAREPAAEPKSPAMVASEGQESTYVSAVAAHSPALGESPQPDEHSVPDDSSPEPVHSSEV